MNPSPPENTRRFSLPAPQRVQVVVFCQPGTASIPGSCCFGGGRHSVAMKLQRRLSVKRRFQATSLCHHEAAGTIPAPGKGCGSTLHTVARNLRYTIFSPSREKKRHILFLLHNGYILPYSSHLISSRFHSGVVKSMFSRPERSISGKSPKSNSTSLGFSSAEYVLAAFF